jgi:hypothetical protein
VTTTSTSGVQADGVVDRLSDRDLDAAIGSVDFLDLECADCNSMVIDRRRDVAVGQVEDFAGGLHGDVERARHHAGVQLDIRCARGLWFHSATGLKIIAVMLGRRPCSERSGLSV